MMMKSRWLLAAVCFTGWASAQARDIEKLSILDANYPRAFFFRSAEGTQSSRYSTYEEWESNFNRLSGIMGKCLDEEVLGREEQNPEYFSRFKKNNPAQSVLLHFNGNARDPRYHTEKYFPGHWVYRAAAMILSDIPAEAGETDIKVDNAQLFMDACGRYQTSKDDIALFGMTADGKHDWNHCEQVQLVSRDLKKNTIRVRRGCYGTTPLRFKKGQARAAAHQTEGPWGATNNLMWFYNFSTACPRDAHGKSCADLVVDDLAKWFGPAGKLAAFDGLEFDVLHHVVHGDTVGDGIEDDGIAARISNYGIGVFEFLRQLRARMGDNFIIQADGALGPGGSRSQRGWGLLNGIESEGFPNLQDTGFEDWSGGLNRHFFWRENARQPVFNYVNHKWNEPVPGKPGAKTNPDVPFSRHRLVLAACQFFDAATCYSFSPPNDPDGKTGIWDELRGGADNNPGWLGRPEGEAVHLAAQTPDLLHGIDWEKRIAGPLDVQVCADGVQITSRSSLDKTRFSVNGIPTGGSDLFVKVRMKAEPLRGYPRDMARFAKVGVSGGAMSLLRENPLETGMRFRDGAETALIAGTGARASISKQTIGGTTLVSVQTHPPYKGGKGYVFWTQEAGIPADASLSFSLGMSDKAPAKSDGVWFRVLVAEVVEGKPGKFVQIFEQSSKVHEWLPQRVSLADYAGKQVRLKFVADCGPNDNATTDQAQWGDVKILTGTGDGSGITPYTDYMTWVNDRFFTSTFYYRDIRSKKVDLSFDIEGAEPVTVQSISVYAHPDAIYRIFENGLVIANPGLEPYTFNLDEISPGRHYRRLKATPRQDRKANNGQPVGRTVTLGERDALFLMRTRQ